MAALALPFLSSPDEATIAPEAAFLARLDAPLGPIFPPNKWPAGVEGREVSGVGIGVDSVDVPALSIFLGARADGASPVADIGAGGSSSFSELEGGVRSSTLE